MTIFQRIIAENTVFKTVTGVKILAFTEVLLSPIQAIKDAFNVYIDEKRYEMSFNGQIIYLEHLLNNAFDNVQRRIYISDFVLEKYPAIVYLFTDNNETAIIYNVVDAQQNQSLIAYTFEDINVQYDFILNVPNDLTAQNLRIKKTLNQYKEASNQYLLINF